MQFPRLHPRAEAEVEMRTEEARKKLGDDMRKVTQVVDEHLRDSHPEKISYVSVCLIH